jgi:opacity protein-like surface antigen
MLRCFVRAVVAVSVAAFAGAPTPAVAQEPVQRPFRRIFGNFPVRANSPQTLDVTVSMFGAYDDNVLAEQTPGGDPRFGEAGAYPGGTADVRYVRRARRFVLTGTGTTALQFYTQSGGETTDQHHGASVELEVPSGALGRLRVAQTAAYATYYTLLGLPGGRPLPSDPVVPGQELLQPGSAYGVFPEGGWEYHSAVALARQFGRRGSLEGRYGFARTDFAARDTRFQEIGATYRQGITTNAALRTGYAFETGTGAVPGETLRYHDIDLGLDYRRALSQSRNTLVAFSTGSTVLVEETRRSYRLLVDASLLRLMGRSWSSSVGYHRGLEYVAALSDVLATDGVTATVAGFVNPALQTAFAASASNGYIGARHGDRLTTYSASARMQYALSRRLALDAQYVYYFYEFAAAVAPPPGLQQTMERQSVRAGITVLLPVLR